MSLAQSHLPNHLFTAANVRELDRIAIEDHNIPGLTLMQRAGTAAFELLCDTWSDAKKIVVVCGFGNNAGDGYVLAKLAYYAELVVDVFQFGDVTRLKGDAKTSYEEYIKTGQTIFSNSNVDFKQYDLVVDALLGTGLDREVTGEFKRLIDRINQSTRPVLALDIPSGLNADTGQPLGAAIVADKTISFIGMKQGLFTGMAADHVGEMSFSDLQVPESVYQSDVQPSSSWIDYQQLKQFLLPRKRTAHKGDFGHVLMIGGDHGYMGACRMAAEAAARTGAGLVSVATRASHAAVLSTGRPELMVQGVESYADLVPLLKKATVLAIGPGLGQGEWAIELFSRIHESTIPQLIDADGLNLLANNHSHSDHRILTPHPGEAARLLNCSTDDIQRDRFDAARQLQQRYGGVVVLKGTGTLIVDTDCKVFICSDGNPGMATGGMGDVLTGIIAGLLAQGYSANDAAKLGACLHAAAADSAAKSGERGLLATDLMSFIRQLVNP